MACLGHPHEQNRAQHRRGRAAHSDGLARETSLPEEVSRTQTFHSLFGRQRPSMWSAMFPAHYDEQADEPEIVLTDCTFNSGACISRSASDAFPVVPTDQSDRATTVPV